MSSVDLRRGALVAVRNPSEILATLDAHGTVAGLPFMPEMAAYCGRRFVVDYRADRMCDTVNYTGSRKLPDSVLLADMRCDGSSHGGCQAECRFYWKEIWLRKVSPDAPPESPVDASDLKALVDFTSSHVKREVERQGRRQDRWVCQHTELLTATSLLRTFDPRTYIGQYTNGNVSLGRCVRVTARAAVEESLDKLGLMPKVFMHGTAAQSPPYEPLNLQPGEWVEIRSKDEIAATLNAEGNNRGLWFDREMAAFCGGKFRVRQRIERFIDDFKDNGKLVEMKSDAVTLDGVVCSGELSLHRWFCPRQIYPYWRDCWLRRVPPPDNRD